LRILDYDVCVAYSGGGTVEIAGRYRPDVAILDINMPAMDGLQTARRLTKIAVWCAHLSLPNGRG